MFWYELKEKAALTSLLAFIGLMVLLFSSKYVGVYIQYTVGVIFVSSIIVWGLASGIIRLFRL